MSAHFKATQTVTAGTRRRDDGAISRTAASSLRDIARELTALSARLVFQHAHGVAMMSGWLQQVARQQHAPWLRARLACAQIFIACALALSLIVTRASAEPPPREAEAAPDVPSQRADARAESESARDLESTRDALASSTELSKLTPEVIHSLLERYASEPTALEVVRAAVRAYERDPDRFASMLSRARWRGLVPSVALGARRGQGVDLRTTLTEDDGLRFTSGDDLVLSATVRFELGRLLFADEEVTIAREARAARMARLELVRDVIHWYYLRRRLQLERDALARTSVTRELKIAELEALLDGFTNGMFGRMIERQRNAWTIDESTPGSAPR